MIDFRSTEKRRKIAGVIAIVIVVAMVAGMVIGAFL